MSCIGRLSAKILRSWAIELATPSCKRLAEGGAADGLQETSTGGGVG
jgi:hypothetical protein